MMTNPLSPRQKLLREIPIMLGAGIVKVELTPDTLDLAFEIALDRYRQRSVNSTEERLAMLDLQQNQQVYQLSDDVIEVANIYRAGTGTAAGGGGYFEPFAASFASQVVMCGYGADAGNLTTWELFSEFQNLVGTMFGMYIQFFWNGATHRLELQQNIMGPETVILHIYNYKPEEVLLNDTYARPWLRSRTLAEAKLMLGQARSKFGSIAGPQGGISMNGPALIAEAKAEIEKLDQELVSGLAGDYMGLSFVHG